MLVTPLVEQGRATPRRQGLKRGKHARQCGSRVTTVDRDPAIRISHQLFGNGQQVTAAVASQAECEAKWIGVEIVLIIR